MSNRKDLALIGIGHWGKNLARNYHQLGALHTIYDSNCKYVDQYKALYPDVVFAESLEAILNNDQIKKVVVAAPTAFHYELSKKALESGKDVFIEKAMSSNVEEAFFLYQLAKQKNAVLMIGHILHYHPCIERIKGMVKGGDLGDLLHLNFSRLNFGSRGPESSALWAFAPHDISILLSLCSPLSLENISCESNRFYSENYTDQSWLSFNFEHQTKATIHVSWLNPIPERKVTIIGTHGSLVFDDMKDWGEKLTFWENSVDLHQGVMKFKPSTEEKIMLDAKEPLLEECAHFLSCCLTRRTPITDGLEGLKVMQILDMAQRSAELNQPIKYEFELDKLLKTEESICKF